MTILSAVDFLNLSERRKVCRIDLSEIGYGGVVYACELTTAQQQEVMTRPSRGKTRVYADRSMDINWSDMPADAGPKWLMSCLVTDKKGGAVLEAAFAETDDDTLLFNAGELVPMADQWLQELKTKSAVLERLKSMPNAVTDLVVRRVREISGMLEDATEEKKES